MSKHNKKKNSRGPDDERFWRRFTSLLREEELWTRNWSLDEMVDFILKNENRPPSREDDKSYRKRLMEEVAKIITSSRSNTTHFSWQGDNSVRPRSREDIVEINEAVSHWSSQLSRLERDEDEWTEEDKQTFSLLIKTWEAMLTGTSLPEGCSIHEHTGMKWKTFNLELEIKRLAARKSGLRFPEFEPALAWMLVQYKHWTLLELLQHRLAWRRKNNLNPFPSSYDSSLESWAETLPDVDAEGEIRKGRVDLRHLQFVTIDPPDAKDFDDAICFEQNGDGSTLWVAIADVAHYVSLDSRLDTTAQARATSVYLPHGVLPMLPFRLADDLCSLRANVPRLAMVIEMKLDENMVIVESKAHEAVIDVKENLAYEDTLEDSRWDNLFTLAEHWQKDELRLNVQQGEQRPRIQEDGSVRIDVKWPNRATKMIETFMVKTNNIVGEILGTEGALLPWRCHPSPDSVDVQDLNEQLKALDIGITLPEPRAKSKGQNDTDELASLLGSWAGNEIDLSGLDSSDDEGPDVPDYLKEVSDQDARDEMLDGLRQAQEKAVSLSASMRRVVDQGLFQLMNRARYDVVNVGHFGLNLDAYAHFTSPIRRYPDLIVHRQLKAHLHNKEWMYNEDELAALSEHCSTQGRMAQMLEWELVAIALNWHLRLSENQQWNARVVGLRTPWIFLDLKDDGSMHGRMHLKQLSKKKNLFIDDHGLQLLEEGRDGQGEHVLLELGQLFPCRIRGLDLWSGRLDLSPV
jgi:hypothetical protein